MKRSDPLVHIAREGFEAAKEYRNNWFNGVNRCPYGPARPGDGNTKAEAWYRGWWFFFHITLRWSEASKTK